MTDMICRKSMTPCRTAGMCAPYGGCPSTESVSSAWLAQLRAEFVTFGEQNKALKTENERLRVDGGQMAADVFHLVNRNAKMVSFLRELRDLEHKHPQSEKIDQVLDTLLAENETPELADLEALRADKARLDSGCIIINERDMFGKEHTCKRVGLDLRSAIDAANALDDQPQPATP